MSTLYYESELYHYGIKGMKWGVRRFQNKDGSLKPAGANRYSNADGSPTKLGQTRQNMRDAKAAYKTANKAFNKSFSKAYNYSDMHWIAANFTKEGKQKSNDLWEDALNKADVSNAARAKYKQAKKNYKAANKERKAKIEETYKEINKNTSIGEKFLYNEATRKAAAKYVVDKNMSIADATKKANKEAIRNTGIFLAAYGAMTVGEMYLRNKKNN